MKQLNIHYFSIVLAAGILCFSQIVGAQTREDVVLKFNEGFELVQAGNDLEAIEVFKETLELAEALGPEGNDIRERVRTQIPQLSFRHAGRLVQQGDDEEAIEAFHQTIEYAEQFDAPQLKARAEGNLPRLYLRMGNAQFRDENFDAAMEAYRQALELNPQYPRALYQIGLVYRQREQLGESLDYFDQAIEIAEQQGDTEMVGRVRAQARDYLIYVAVNAMDMDEYSTSLSLLERAVGYDDRFSDTYYRLAEVSNHMENWTQALEHGRRALELSDEGRTGQAKVWFEIGLAYKNLNNREQACEAFENAAFGQFQDAAEHEMEFELECHRLGR